MNSQLRAVASLVSAAALLFLAPVPASAIDPAHARSVRDAYGALSTTYYRGIADAALVDGARREIAETVRKAKAKHPVRFAAASHAGASDQILASIDAARAQSALSETDLTYAALRGMAKATGDRYTTFFSPAELRGFTASLNPAHIFGIGVLLGEDEATHDVRASYIPPGTPADAAGMKQGDLFETVDGSNVRGVGLQRLRTKLLGARGTTVLVRVSRDGKVAANPFAITRADVHAPTVYEKMLAGNVGYVVVGAFGEPTAAEFSAAIGRLGEQHAVAYVIDLRFNGGGYVGAAVAIAQTFIRTGPIVSVAARSGTTEYDAEAVAIAPKPVAILVNHYSASASEITAGALQDTGVGTLVGSRTYGKGVVQQLTPFADGSAMKITTAQYLTPHRRMIDKVGLVPDVAVEENAHAKFGDPAADKQLAAAITVVEKKALAERG